MDKELYALASQVLEAAFARSARDRKSVKYAFSADEALVIVQTTLERAARSGAKPNDLHALRETLEALRELGASAPERKLVELVTTRLRAAGVKSALSK
jgi:hypothetical protein